MYKLAIEKRVYKDLDTLPWPDVTRIQKAIFDLKNNPRPMGSQKLQGYLDRYRIRQGNYRIIYGISDQDKIISIFMVSHRKDAYHRGK